jgi:hypothetical protein
VEALCLWSGKLMFPVLSQLSVLSVSNQYPGYHRHTAINVWPVLQIWISDSFDRLDIALIIKEGDCYNFNTKRVLTVK